MNKFPPPPSVTALCLDIETDGLLDTMTTIHCFNVRDAVTDRLLLRCSHQAGRDFPVENGLRLLHRWVTADPARSLVIHNGIGFDIPAIQKLYPWFIVGWQQIQDTLVLSRLWKSATLFDEDMARRQADPAGFPGNLLGSHSLEAWGIRLGEAKGDYVGDPALVDQLVRNGMPEAEAQKVAYSRRWESWNEAMSAYCDQDTKVGAVLWRALTDPAVAVAPAAAVMEHQVHAVLCRQERRGFFFDEDGARALYVKLVARRIELEDTLRTVFLPRFLPAGEFTPARDNARMGYVGGAKLTKVALTEFNPQSRSHIATWLKAEYGWTPTEFTATGEPMLSDEIIAKLPFPQAAPLKEYMLICKRLGQIGDGNNAWLKKVNATTKALHGRVNGLGAHTGRMTHMEPNLAQVPSGKSPYGHECRALFKARPGYDLVGADADALELRCLAGFIAIYDQGAYIRTVLEGRKEDGTDMHTVNCRALGLDPKAPQWDGTSGRDVAKVFFYAFLYGAGGEKLGNIVTGAKGDKARRLGNSLKKKFLAGLPALGALVESIQTTVAGRGYLRGLDGRYLHARSASAAVNTLLQSAGALIMKKALCILDDDLQAAGLVPGEDYEFVANVHDEWQIEVRPQWTAFVAKAAPEAIRKAGEHFKFRCPTVGNADIGKTWNDTH